MTHRSDPPPMPAVLEPVRFAAKAALWTTAAVSVAAFAIFMCGMCSGVIIARAQSSTSPLESALLHRMRLPAGPYIAHCRQRREGCERYVARLALAIDFAAHDAGIDPYLLAAVVLHESGLNSDAVGRAGEFSVAQLHPRSAWGRRAARGCRVSPSDCTAIVLGEAARLLASAVERCGSEAAALGAYHSGRCEAGDPYACVVLRLRDQLRGET